MIFPGHFFWETPPPSPQPGGHLLPWVHPLFGYFNFLSFPHQTEPFPSLSNGTLPSSSSSVASRLYLNGRNSSRRDSFSSEPELMQFHDHDSIGTDFSNATNQVSRIRLGSDAETLGSPLFRCPFWRRN